MKFNKSHILTIFLLLALAYFSQVRESFHIHHFHEITSNLPIDTHSDDSNHASDHHHHDEDNSQTDDHQHQYDTQLDWHFVRTVSGKTVTSSDQYVYVLNSFLLYDYRALSIIHSKEPPKLKSFENSPSIIRGPPSIV